MSTTGPPVVIPAPQSGAPAVSLLRSALVIDHGTDLSLEDALAEAARAAENGGIISAGASTIDARWGNGIVFSPTTCADATIFDPCTAGAAALANANNRPAAREYDPFVVNSWDRCSTFGFRAAEYEARARQMMAARESKAIAREFWTGALNAANPHLADNPNVTTIGTALSPHNAVAELSQAIADGNGGIGMIHVRPRLLEILVTKNGLRWENGQWYTARGVKVVADDGYPGTGPNAQAITGEPAGPVVEWAFATDLVEVHRGPVKVFAPPDTYQSVAHATNDEVVRAQRLAAPIWNGCVLAAVSISTPAAD